MSVAEAVEERSVQDAWGIPWRAAGCPHCGVAYLLPADSREVVCPACWSARLEPQPARLRPEPPELVLPFSINASQAAQSLKSWLHDVLFRPSELDPAILVSRLNRTFVAMWLVDGRVIGTWQAQLGYDYEVASSREELRAGGWTSQPLTETRVRWEPRLGELDRVYPNVAVPALHAHAALMEQIGKYDFGPALPYRPEMLQSALVRVPDLLPEEALPVARSELERHAQADCQAAAGAQHLERVSLECECRELHWTMLLLPVYSTGYRDDDGRWLTVMINGQIGHVGGIKRASLKQARGWTLLLGGLAVAAFALALLLWVLAGDSRLAAVIGSAAFLSSLVMALAAPIPIVWAWQYNRQN